MTPTKKVKLIILLAVIIFIALFGTVIIQIVKINKAEREISKQQEQIQMLEKQLDSYSKSPNTDYETVS